MKTQDCVLIITGCIFPEKDIPILKLTDANERKKQYVDSIKYYIEHGVVDNIVYCDNSGAAVEEEVLEFAEQYKKKFEWLSYKGDSDKVKEKGKGYGEGEIMNFVLENSRLVQDCSILVKVTGRLKIRNFNMLVLCASHKIFFAPNLTNDERIYINTRFYIMPKEMFVKYFRRAYLLVDDCKGCYLEHAFGMCVTNYKIKYKTFLVYPAAEGMSGSTGILYNASFWQLMKDTVKMHIARIRSEKVYR